VSNDLTEQEAAKLFEQVSNASRENDSLKLSELMQADAIEEVAPVEEDKPEETPAEVVDEEVKPDKVEADKASSPPEKAEEVEPKEEVKPSEPSELEKLREQVARLDKENHRLSSQAGRVPYVQRKIKEIDKKLEDLAKASPSSHPSAEIQKKVLEKLKVVRDNDPELADAIAGAIAALGEATDGITDEVKAKEIDSLKHLRQLEVSAYQEAEANRILEVYPNAPEVFASNEWKKWKAEQTSAWATLANSDTADDVMFAMEKYAKDMIAKYPELAKEEPKGVETPAVDAKAKEEAQKVEAERQRKQKTSVVIGSPSAPSKVGLPDDPNALFEKFSGEIRKQISG
jgi:hypothetical protein